MEVEDEAKRRKRMKESFEEKLLVGEKVEVLFMDEGFAGSWHAGVIINRGITCRQVEFTHLLNDDKQSQFKQWITVSAAVAGDSSSDPKGYRGNIRPLPSQHDVKVSDVKYGLCVDALVEDAWWEGVVFDNNDDSFEKLIFFPDEGDLQKITVDQLRLTQEWDEVSGCWKPRGEWMLLQVLETFKKEHDLPVSVRQIWYDLRATDAFLNKIGSWPCGQKHIWQNLVRDLMQLLLSVVNATPLTGTGVSNLIDAPLTSDDIGGRVLIDLQMDGVEWLSQNMQIDNNHSLTHAAKEVGEATDCSRALSEFIFKFHNRDGCNNQLDPSSRLEDQNKAEGSSASTITASWEPVILQPEYCDDLASICKTYIKYDRTKAANKNTEKLRKHLLHQGWRIDFKRDTMPRFRYLPPNGNTYYYSLNKVCCVLIDQKYRNDNILEGCSSHLERAQVSSRDIGLLAVNEDVFLKNEHTKYSIDMSEMADSEGLLHSSCMLTSTTAVVNDRACFGGGSSISRKQSMPLKDVSLKEGPIEVYLPAAIRKYVDFIEKGQWKKDKVLTKNAKKHLKITGWNLWKKEKKVKKEIVYTSPGGKNYISLYRACKGLMEEHKKNYTEKSTKSMNAEKQFEVQPSAAKVEKSIKRDTNCRPCSFFIASNSDVFQGATHEGGVRSSAEVCNRLVQKPSGNFSNNQKSRRMHTRANTKQCRGPSSRFLPCLPRSNKTSQLVVEPSTSQHSSKTVLSWLIDKDAILPRQKVTYFRKTDGRAMKHGRVTREGIKCNCCYKVFSLVNFEAHAGCNTSRPAASIFSPDCKSLLQYQMQVVLANKPKCIPYARLKRNYSHCEGDFECSICCDGGNLVLCDHCPSAFHPDCVGLEDVPEGNWCCAPCQCGICGLSEFNCNINQFTDKSVLNCDQCERGYHIGCLRERGSSLSSCPTGSWACSKKCAQIFNHLQKLLGKSNPTTVERLSWTILRSSEENSTNKFDDETIAEYHSKLYIALDVLHECFEPLIEPRTQSDVLSDLLFNRVSELHRLNFRGMYTVILEREDELISVATFRVFGEKVAEMPFIGTRLPFRCKGMCRLLVDELEKLLSTLGVERLVLPAVPQLLPTWTGSFGFIQMTNSDRMELLEYNLLSFQDAPMCQKFLRTPSKILKEPRGNCKTSSIIQGTDVNYSISFEKSPSSDVEICSLPCIGDTVEENSQEVETAVSFLDDCFEDKTCESVSADMSEDSCLVEEPPLAVTERSEEHLVEDLGVGTMSSFNHFYTRRALATT